MDREDVSNVLIQLCFEPFEMQMYSHITKQTNPEKKIEDEKKKERKKTN